MALFGRGEDHDEERAERAHAAIEDADAGVAVAHARSREARSRAFELADREVGAEQVSVDAATALAGESFARAVIDADDEADRTIHRATEKAASKKDAAWQKAAAGISKATDAAAESRDFELTRAAQLREHASFDPPPAADTPAALTS
jgi:hypothetical protein